MLLCKLSRNVSADSRNRPRRRVCTKYYALVLTHARAGTKKKRGDDDDDFIVNDDESEEEPYAKASSSRRSSFASTDASRYDLDDEDEDDAPKRPKAMKKAASSAPKKLAEVASVSGAGSNFLTAAEQRALDKKDDKKKAESPFSFLQDIRDVGIIPPLTNA